MGHLLFQVFYIASVVHHDLSQGDIAPMTLQLVGHAHQIQSRRSIPIASSKQAQCRVPSEGNLIFCTI